MGRRMLIGLQLALLLLALFMPQEIYSSATTPPATTKAPAPTKSGVCALQSTVSVLMVSLFLLVRLHC